MINLVDNDKSEVRATVRPVSRTLVRRLQIKALVTKLLRVGPASVSQGHQRSGYLPL